MTRFRHGFIAQGAAPAWVLRPASGAPAMLDLDWGSGRWFGSGREYTDFDVALSAVGGTFSRASTALYWGASGVLQLAAANAPRFDHDPATGAARGVLLEGSRANALLHSEDFSNAAWTKVRMTVDPDAAAAPDGTTTADKLTRNSTTLTCYAKQSYSAAIGKTVTVSCFVKPAAAGNQYGLRVQGTYPDRADAVFDLAAKTVRGTAATNFTGTTAGIEDIGGGFLRCWLTTTIAHSAALLMVHGPTDASRAIGQWEAPSTVLADAYVWGAPAEEGAFPSSYIPTTTGAVTRAADSLTAAQAGTAEGAIVLHGRAPAGKEGDQVLWQWDGGSENSRLRLVRDASGGMRFIVTSGGVEQANIADLGVVADGTDFKAAAAWAVGDFAAYLNGVAGTPDAGGTVPALTTERWGADSAGNQWFGTLARAAHFDFRPANADLQGWTA